MRRDLGHARHRRGRAVEADLQRPGGIGRRQLPVLERAERPGGVHALEHLLRQAELPRRLSRHLRQLFGLGGTDFDHGVTPPPEYTSKAGAG